MRRRREYASTTVRTLVIGGALAVLACAVVLAASSHKGPSYTTDEVIEAFARQGFALAEPENVPGDNGQTITAVFAPGANPRADTFLFPAEQDFYVLVARNDALAARFFEPLARAGGGPGTFDSRRGNVVVSSDASLTSTGLTPEQRHRIRIALDSLAWDEQSFIEAFDKVAVGM